MSTQSWLASPVVFATAATVLMRCRAEEKWLRTLIFTLGVPFQLRLGGCGLGTGGGWGAPGSSLAMAAWRCVSASASSLSRAGSAKFSVGRAVCVLGSNLHFMPISAACSRGSPNVRPSTWTSEWQPAITSDAFTLASGHGCRSPMPPPPLLAPAPAPASFLGVTTPIATSLSEVSVPVLSNRHVSTLPLSGTRKGSVQNTEARMRAMSAVFTAIAVCMGSSGGTTEVRMRIHRNTSSYWLRLPSRSPLMNTCPDANSANTSRMNRSTSVSHVSPVTASELNSIMRINLPCVDPNPVCST
mmetsp:Transcript_32187/g.80918  ORF Transcript_32187/g.80918 Transcript_32187/m.80918 type:complete len:300 (+) Transcript_32187:2778-3677(+)